MTQPDFLDSGATFSECERYRYTLWRVWDRRKPRALFVMLNPSTADATQLDPTVRRCVGFAQSWGYGRLDAWGMHAKKSRVNAFCLLAATLERKLFALGTTKSGQPRHPLYLRKTLTPDPWIRHP